MSYLTKDQLESYLNKLPNSGKKVQEKEEEEEENDNSNNNNINESLATSFHNLTTINGNNPDTPKPSPQKSFSNNNKKPNISASALRQKRTIPTTTNNSHTTTTTARQKERPYQEDELTTYVLNPTVVQNCPNCHKPIQGSVVSAMNTLWHAHCFTCYKCNKSMEQEKYYEHKGHPYCYKDYKKLFCLTCDFCKKPIDSHAVSALGKHYHQDHFCCTVCNKPFDKGQFMLHNNQPYCERDYLRTCGKTCFGCQDYIKNEYVNALGHEWHKACFTCTVCKKPFSNGTFRVRDDRPYCEKHASTVINTPDTSYKPPGTTTPLTKRQPALDRPTPTTLSNPRKTSSSSTTTTTTPRTANKNEQQQQQQQQEKKICHQCNEKIFGPCATALGHHYHVSHFQCVYCSRTLSSRVPAMWQGDARGELTCKQCASKNQ